MMRVVHLRSRLAKRYRASIASWDQLVSAHALAGLPCQHCEDKGCTDHLPIRCSPSASASDDRAALEAVVVALDWHAVRSDAEAELCRLTPENPLAAQTNAERARTLTDRRLLELLRSLRQLATV